MHDLGYIKNRNRVALDDAVRERARKDLEAARIFHKAQTKVLEPWEQIELLKWVSEKPTRSRHAD